MRAVSGQSGQAGGGTEQRYLLRGEEPSTAHEPKRCWWLYQETIWSHCFWLQGGKNIKLKGVYEGHKPAWLRQNSCPPTWSALCCTAEGTIVVGGTNGCPGTIWRQRGVKWWGWPWKNIIKIMSLTKTLIHTNLQITLQFKQLGSVRFFVVMSLKEISFFERGLHLFI